MSEQVNFTPWEELAHTADWALRVRGRTLQELFVNAALGMYHMVADVERLDPAGERRIEVEAATVSGLLVAWLNELIFFTDVEGLAFHEIAIEELSEPGDLARDEWARLAARVSAGRPPRLLKTIKAVTHHYATIEHSAGLYQVDLVFDV